MEFKTKRLECFVGVAYFPCQTEVIGPKGADVPIAIDEVVKVTFPKESVPRNETMDFKLFLTDQAYAAALNEACPNSFKEIKLLGNGLQVTRSDTQLFRKPVSIQLPDLETRDEGSDDVMLALRVHKENVEIVKDVRNNKFDRTYKVEVDNFSA